MFAMIGAGVAGVTAAGYFGGGDKPGTVGRGVMYGAVGLPLLYGLTSILPNYLDRKRERAAALETIARRNARSDVAQYPDPIPIPVPVPIR